MQKIGPATSSTLSCVIQSYVDAYSDTANISDVDSRYCVNTLHAGDATVPGMRRHVARRAEDHKKNDPSTRRGKSVSGWEQKNEGRSCPLRSHQSALTG